MLASVPAFCSSRLPNASARNLLLFRQDHSLSSPFFLLCLVLYCAQYVQHLLEESVSSSPLPCSTLWRSLLRLVVMISTSIVRTSHLLAILNLVDERRRLHPITPGKPHMSRALDAMLIGYTAIKLLSLMESTCCYWMMSQAILRLRGLQFQLHLLPRRLRHLLQRFLHAHSIRQSLSSHTSASTSADGRLQRMPTGRRKLTRIRYL